MEVWIKNGAELAWLIDPQKKKYWIFRPGQAVEGIAEGATLIGEGPVQGFRLNLTLLD